MKAEDFEEKFDQGESVTGDLNLYKTCRPEQEQRRISIDLRFIPWTRNPDDSGCPASQLSRCGLPRSSKRQLDKVLG